MKSFRDYDIIYNKKLDFAPFKIQRRKKKIKLKLQTETYSCLYNLKIYPH